MAWNFTESVNSTVQVGSGVQLLDASTAALYTAGLDSAKDLYAKTPQEGSQYFTTRSVDKNNYKSQKVHSIGLAEVNSDLDELPLDKQQMGFTQTISNFVIRKAMAIGREALETDRHGVIGKHARNLIHSGQKTLEFIWADAFNRGFGTANGATSATSNLSLLCEDGLALFSGNRPQARTSAGVWSNLRTAGALTADSVAAARVSFNTFIDSNGDLAPQMLQKVIVSPDLADTMDEISNTSLKVDTSLNTTNVVSGTPYDVWHWLTAGTILYCGDGENELEFHVRKNPETKTWEDGSNPDRINSRLYMAVGSGCFCPFKWIGQKTA
jgi:hypothetical protein